MKKSVKSNGSKNNAVKNNKPAKAAKPAPKKGAKPAKAEKREMRKPVRRFVFEFPVSRVAHKLGKLGWKPADAFNAIRKMKGCADVLASTIRTQVGLGKAGQRNKQLADLTGKQIAQLKKLAAAA